MNATLKKAEKFYACDQAKAMQPSIDEKIRDTSALLNGFLNSASSSTSQASPESISTQEREKECTDFAETWDVLFFRQLKIQGVIPENLNQILNKASEFKPALVEAIRQAEAEYAKSTFGNILMSIASTDTSTGNSSQ